MLRTPPSTWSIPVLETPRLRLRAHTLADFAPYAALWADPIVARYTIGPPATPEETWSRLLRHAGHWSLLGFGSWLIEEKSTGDVTGETGFFDYHRDLDPPLTTPEIGWIIAPAKHNLGYATEAVEALLAWGRRRFLSTELACLIAAENLPSLRVAAKCGFTESHAVAYRGHHTLVLTRKL